ncbi:DUF4291 family protein [Streptomyces sp. NPDC048417]|uniref:DUF4291 family protein n=1 Tax=Streptomyces sp. NPDC048417 TaxID=3155387 RepID=UPI003428774F
MRGGIRRFHDRGVSGISGSARKLNQETILRIDMERAGFERALAHAALSHFQPGVHEDRAQAGKSLVGCESPRRGGRPQGGASQSAVRPWPQSEPLASHHHRDDRPPPSTTRRRFRVLRFRRCLRASSRCSSRRTWRASSTLRHG